MQQGRFRLTIAAGWLLIMAMACMITGCGATSIDLSQYLDAEYSGVSGHATATAVLDTEGLKNEIHRIMAERRGTTATDEYTAETDIIGSIVLNLEGQENLANGDMVTVEADFNEKILSKYGIKLTNSSRAITVSDLVELPELLSAIDLEAVRSELIPAQISNREEETTYDYVAMTATTDYSFDYSTPIYEYQFSGQLTQTYNVETEKWDLGYWPNESQVVETHFTGTFEGTQTMNNIPDPFRAVYEFSDELDENGQQIVYATWYDAQNQELAKGKYTLEIGNYNNTLWAQGKVSGSDFWLESSFYQDWLARGDQFPSQYYLPFCAQYMDFTVTPNGSAIDGSTMDSTLHLEAIGVQTPQK